MPQYTQLSPGLYLYRIESHLPSGQIDVNLEPTSSGRGVHDSFWYLFCEILNDLAAESIRKSQPDANTFLAGANEVADAISNDSANRGIWYSAIRNEINYQHKHEVWFPLKRRAKALIALGDQRIIDSSSYQLNISKKKDPLAAFTNLSRFLACLNIELSDFIAQRSTIGGAFGQKWRRISEQIKV